VDSIVISKLGAGCVSPVVVAAELGMAMSLSVLHSISYSNYNKLLSSLYNLNIGCPKFLSF
jgi:hypothetical protein